MNKRKLIPVIIICVIISAMIITPVIAGGGVTKLVSVGEVPFNTSTSADGRYVVFVSGETNLVPGDTNAKKDIFLRDLQTSTTTLISVDSDEVQANNDSSVASISADGRYVAFTSNASNLVVNDTNNTSDVFLRDLESGTTTRASLNSDGTQANGYSQGVSISPNGRFVAFHSGASNLVDDDTNSREDIFRRDLFTNTTVRASLATDGTQGNNGSFSPSLSADGRFVAFVSTANNLVPNDTNYAPDIFVHDFQENTTERVSVSSTGTQGTGNFASYDVNKAPAISYDGRFVVFYSPATDLVIDDTNNYDDIFVHDRDIDATIIVSLAMEGEEADSASKGASISADGRYVAFQSAASNLVENDTNGYGFQDIFVRDLFLNSTTRVSVASDGTQADHGSGFGTISADGLKVIFQSDAFNLDPEAIDGLRNIFIHEIGLIPECYALTLDYSGTGEVPSAFPEKSDACGIGEYTVGSTVFLTAYPGGDNTVGSWTGSNFDTSTSTTNTVTIPAASLNVTVNYVGPAVGTPDLISPIGNILTNNPEFIWSEVPDSTQYRLALFQGSTVILDKTLDNSICSAGSCAYTPDPSLNLAAGSYRWKIKAFKSVWGSYSALSDFAYINAPAAPTTVTPNGSITAKNPTFTWNKVSGANQYRLYASNSGGAVLDITLTSSVCGTSTCTYTPNPALNLANGSYTWKVKASNGVWGSYSAARTMIKRDPPLPQFPSVTSTSKNPKLIWGHVSAQTQYRVILINSGGTVLLDKTVTSSSVCTSTVCTYTPSPALTLANGTYKWKVRSYNGIWGDYSAYMTFNKVNPPTQNSPSGTITSSNPAFTWTKIANATKYYIVLVKANGTSVRNMTVDATVCGSSTCTYTPSPVLGLLIGDYKWKIKAYNGYYGDYSAYKAFKRQ